MLNTLKNIAFISEEGADEGPSSLGEQAARLARAHDAHLIGIYAIDTMPTHPASGHVRGARALQEASAERRREQERRVIRAGRHLARLTSRHGTAASSAW